MLENQNNRKCRNCGNTIESTVCPLCKSHNPTFDDYNNQNLDKQDTHINNTKSRYIASVLAILFGCFGAHRFYLKRYRSAILYLLFWWIPIVGILANIEAILIVIFGRENLYKYIIKDKTLIINEATNIVASVAIIVLAVCSIIRILVFSTFTSLAILFFRNQDIPLQMYDIFRWFKEFFEYYIY